MFASKTRTTSRSWTSRPQGDGALRPRRQGRRPAGLGFDAKNRILFAMCHDPQTCVVLNADDGKILATLPIAEASMAAGSIPIPWKPSARRRWHADHHQGKQPTSFEVEQTVQTKSRAKTCTLDTGTTKSS